MTTFDPTKPCKARDGRDVVIYCTDAPGDWPIHGRVDGLYCPYAWRANGKVSFCPEDHPHDLVNVKQRKEAWVNVYRYGSDGAIIATISGCATESEAKKKATPSCIATVKIEWEE